MVLSRSLVAEALGTAFLLAAVVGSGIMAERLSGGNVGIALLCNSLATGAMLVVLISIFGPVSGAPKPRRYTRLPHQKVHHHRNRRSIHPVSGSRRHLGDMGCPRHVWRSDLSNLDQSAH
jgi:Major intrinsic protein